MIFGVMAAAVLVASLRPLFIPAKYDNRTAIIVGVLCALFLGLLSFRAYRETKLQTKPEDGRVPANPKALVGITVFGLLLGFGDLRLVLSGRANQVYIGIGQAVIWLPILTYLGYREFRRMTRL